MKVKVLTVCKSFLWCIIILLFPILSGTLSAILRLDTVETLFLQGVFMVLSLIPPAVFVLKDKRGLKTLGFARFDVQGCKKALYFTPLLLIFVPVAIKGFQIKSAGYVLGSLFLYIFVGIAEEVYFRGVIPDCLKKVFSDKGIVLLSTVIFAVGHIAAAFSGSNAFEIALSVFNAFIFGWLAIEMTMLASNIVPAIFMHFFFDFETKIVVMDGSELLIAECVRGVLMVIMTVWLAIVLKKENALKIEF